MVRTVSWSFFFRDAELRSHLVSKAWFLRLCEIELLFYWLFLCLKDFMNSVERSDLQSKCIRGGKAHHYVLARIGKK
jgi:hypothetical protein